MKALVRRLDWDSQHFGVSIGRVDAPVVTASSAADIAREMEEAAISCAYLLIDAADRSSFRAATTAGARPVDLRMTYELDLARMRVSGTETATPTIVRSATMDDLSALEPLAAEAHRDSRFYFDGNFDESRVDELYRTWIRKSVTGDLANDVITFDLDGRAGGYVSWSSKGEEGDIGLVAIAEGGRGKGAASTLLRRALTDMAKSGAKRVSVVTQGRNAAAQRLYQRAGFVLRDVAAWLHLWSGS